MFKFLLVIFVALCLGIGSGLAQNWWEFGGVEEQFTVFQTTIESTTNENTGGGGGAGGGQAVESSEALVAKVEVKETTIHNFGSLEKGETGMHESTKRAFLSIKLDRHTPVWKVEKPWEKLLSITDFEVAFSI